MATSFTAAEIITDCNVRAIFRIVPWQMLNTGQITIAQNHPLIHDERCAQKILKHIIPNVLQIFQWRCKTTLKSCYSLHQPSSLCKPSLTLGKSVNRPVAILRNKLYCMRNQLIYITRGFGKYK